MTLRLLILLSSSFIFGAGCYGQAQETGSDPAWEVTGTVRNARGGLKGVWVRIAGPMHRSVATGPDGRYSFSGTVPGTYSIQVQKPDDAGEPRSRTLTLSAGQKVQNFDIVLPRGAVIAGRVSDAAGSPLPGMVVVAYLRSFESGALRLHETGGALTDDRGAYRIAHLPDGEYVVGVVSTMRRPLRIAPRSSQPVTSPPVYPPVTFAPNGRIPAVAALIQVRDGEERMAPDVTLQREPAYCAFFSTPTPPAVSFEISISLLVTEWIGTRGPTVARGPLRPGQELQVCALPRGDYHFSFVAYSKQPLKAEPSARALHVAAGLVRSTIIIDKEDRELPALSLNPATDVSGRILVKGTQRTEGVPPGIRIRLLPRHRTFDPGDQQVALVRADGSFEFVKAYPDEYIFRVENMPAGYYIVRSEQGQQNLAEVDLRTDGGNVTIELSPDGPTLSGRVLTDDREPAPVAEATVFLVARKGGRVQAAQSDQSGTYSFPSGVEPGDYKIVAVTGLSESQRRDGTRAGRFMSRAVEVSLRERETKTVDVRISGGS
jgi:hypothetical protein